MKKGAIWFLMLFKRQLKKLSIYIILAVMLISCLLIRYAAKNLSVAVEIGVVNEDGSEMSINIEEGLYSHRGLIVFKAFDSEEELKKAVQTGRVLGGYIIKEGFSEKLLNENAGEDTDGGSGGNADEDTSEDNGVIPADIIQALATPNNMFSGLANEIFFSFVMKEISYEELVKDTGNTGLFSKLTNEEMREELRGYYDVNLSNGSTFSLAYDRGPEEYAGKSVNIDIYDYISPVIAGIVGLMIFLGGLCGNIHYYDDRKNGSLSLLRPVYRQLVAVIETAIPVAVIAAAGVIIMTATGLETNVPRVILKYALYGLMVVAYCFILKCIIRKKELYIGFIPLLMLLSLLFCPVFVNVSSMAPSLAGVGKALPLYWLYMM